MARQKLVFLSSSFTFEDDGDFSKYGDFGEDDGDSGSGDDDSDVEQDGDNKDEEIESEDDGIQKISSKNILEEIEKGRAVKHEIEMCDKLLENRILLQEIVKLYLWLCV